MTLNILIFILKVAPVSYLSAVFSLFSCESDNLTFTLFYSTIYMLALKKPLLFLYKTL